VQRKGKGGGGLFGRRGTDLLKVKKRKGKRHLFSKRRRLTQEKGSKRCKRVLTGEGRKGRRTPGSRWAARGVFKEIPRLQWGVWLLPSAGGKREKGKVALGEGGENREWARGRGKSTLVMGGGKKNVCPIGRTRIGDLGLAAREKVIPKKWHQKGPVRGEKKRKILSKVRKTRGIPVIVASVRKNRGSKTPQEGRESFSGGGKGGDVGGVSPDEREKGGGTYKNKRGGTTSGKTSGENGSFLPDEGKKKDS